MARQLRLGDVTADVVLKDIRNIHLSVYPPTGRVRISAPLHMSLDTIRVFAIAKLGWIRKQQARLRAQVRETPHEYVDRESHHLWGRRYLLKVVEADRTPSIEVKGGSLLLRARAGSDRAKRRDVMDAWYRDQLREAVPPLIAAWAPAIGVTVERFFVQRMRTRWGSCSPGRRTIRLNTDLARKPRECLEYIVVHELAHLSEPTHSARFVALMDRLIPGWRHRRDQLNQLPVRHEEWSY